MLAVTSAVHSELSDVQVQEISDGAAVVTAWLQQSYTIGGRAQRIQAPASASLRRDNSHWSVVSFHSIPLAG